MMIDPIADLLVRLRNAQAVHRDKVVLPHSNMKTAILTILHKEGVVVGFGEKLVRGKKVLEVTLPAQDRKAMVPDFVRVSKPGRRMYVKAKDIPRPLKGYGLVVLSTPQGIMTGKEAHRRGLGGELLFKER